MESGQDGGAGAGRWLRDQRRLAEGSARGQFAALSRHGLQTPAGRHLHRKGRERASSHLDGSNSDLRTCSDAKGRPVDAVRGPREARRRGCLEAIAGRQCRYGCDLFRGRQGHAHHSESPAAAIGHPELRQSVLIRGLKPRAVRDGGQTDDAHGDTQGEKEPISTSPQNALWCRAALSSAKLDNLSISKAWWAPMPLEGGLTRYISTRGEAPALGFCDVMLTGLARDGGLYVPEAWPQLSSEVIAGFFGRPYWEVAVDVIRPFVGAEISDADLGRMANEAYATFRHPAVVPLSQMSPNQFVLELFHGPTLAFKDVAMQLISRLMDHVLAKRAQRTTIVVATSGDTGGAAVDAFAGLNNVDLIVLFPHGRISDVQRRMMTTAGAGNVHALAIEGTFDDCQALVKALFNHHKFRDRVALSGVNSINWARIVAQIVYYFTSAVALGAPARTVDFTVPTGNFGDIFAGYAAKRMGLPVRWLRIAANVNDILPRTLKTGIYEVRDVHATASPSMDIQISSNFERLLFEASRRDAAGVRRLMDQLKQSGRFVLPDATLAAVREEFDAGRADETETAAAIRAAWREAGDWVDPHTAVALAVADRDTSDSNIPNIVLSTAHAAKFPDAVEAACGVRPELPAWLEDLTTRPEHIKVMNNDQVEVERFVRSVSRAAKQGVAG